LASYKLRNIWNNLDRSASSSSDSIERFKVKVFSRFRPIERAKYDSNGIISTGSNKTIVLPLHQRLQLLRISRRATTTREALKVLKTEGAWFGAKWKNIEDERAKKTDTIIPNKSVQDIANKENFVACVQNVDPATGRIVMMAPDVGLREFIFDGVLPLKSTQDLVYSTIGKRLVMDFINGFNATAIVYGQVSHIPMYLMIIAEILILFTHFVAF